MTDNNVLVFSENREIAFQLLAKGGEFANKLGGEVYALVVGSGVTGTQEYFEYGADNVYVIDEARLAQFEVVPYREAVLKAVEEAEPHILLIGATKRGKELAARVAAALDTGCMTECVDLELDEEGRLKAERLTYGGSSISTQVSNKEPHIATVSSRVFEKMEPSKKKGEAIKLDLMVPESRVRIVERKEKTKGDMGLEESPVIVSAGRGFKEKDDLKLLKEIAKVLDAKIGCTRPIAADLGWMEEWIGISGHKIAPKLYIACGVSGTIQHAAGIRDSQIIVSINSEEGANIHELSDYSIVGDLYVVLPALTKALKEKLK